MIKEIHLKDRKIEYELQYKKVKNINLRVKPDGKVCVSASRRVSVELIEKFMQSKADFILKALEKYDAMKVDPLKEYFSEKEIRSFNRFGSKMQKLMFDFMAKKHGCKTPLNYKPYEE